MHNDCEVLSQFAQDFKDNTDLLTKFQKGELSVEAWQLLKASY